MPLLVPTPQTLTPEEHAQLAWAWLRAQCAPSTWDKFAASVAVRQPQVRKWEA